MAAKRFKVLSCYEFARRVLGRAYTPAQGIWIRVAVDHVQPAQLEGREGEIAREMFGNVDEVPPGAYRHEVLYAGRDSFKSGLAIDVALWRMATADLGSIGPGEVPVVLVASPDLKTSRMLVRRALATVKESPELAESIDSESADGFVLRRPHDGKLVAFEAAAASRGGFTARGKPVLGLILEESDLHYSGDLYVRTDDEMVRAASPRLMKDGWIIFITTPWGAESRARKFFNENYGAPKTALVALASTLLMRDNDPAVVANIQAEMAADEANARREFFCDMTCAGDSYAFPDADRPFAQPNYGLFTPGQPFAVTDPGESLDDFVLLLCTMLEPKTEPEYLRLQAPLGMGISPDVFVGYATDDCGRRIQLKQPKNPLLCVYHLACWPGPRVRELGMRTVVDEIAATLKGNGIDLLISDQRGAPYLAALLSERGIRMRSFAMNPQNKHEAVIFLRTLMRDGNIAITTGSPHSEAFKRQLSQYKRVQMPGGNYRYTGGSRSAVDDWPAALVTLGVCLTQEQTNPSDETYYRIDNAPTTKTLGRKFVIGPGSSGFE